MYMTLNEPAIGNYASVSSSAVPRKPRNGRQQPGQLWLPELPAEAVTLQMVLELGGDWMTAAFHVRAHWGEAHWPTQSVVMGWGSVSSELPGREGPGALIEEIVFCMVQKEESAKEYSTLVLGSESREDMGGWCWAAWWVEPVHIALGCSQIVWNDVIGEDEAGCADCPEALFLLQSTTVKAEAIVKLFSNHLVLRGQFCLRGRG